jgi:hypothetical protein
VGFALVIEVKSRINLALSVWRSRDRHRENIVETMVPRATKLIHMLITDSRVGSDAA